MQSQTEGLHVRASKPIRARQGWEPMQASLTNRQEFAKFFVDLVQATPATEAVSQSLKGSSGLRPSRQRKIHRQNVIVRDGKPYTHIEGEVRARTHPQGCALFVQCCSVQTSFTYWALSCSSKFSFMTGECSSRSSGKLHGARIPARTSATITAVFL